MFSTSACSGGRVFSGRMSFAGKRGDKPERSAAVKGLFMTHTCPWPHGSKLQVEIVLLRTAYYCSMKTKIREKKSSRFFLLSVVGELRVPNRLAQTSRTAVKKESVVSTRMSTVSRNWSSSQTGGVEQQSAFLMHRWPSCCIRDVNVPEKRALHSASPKRINIPCYTQARCTVYTTSLTLSYRSAFLGSAILLGGPPNAAASQDFGTM